MTKIIDVQKGAIMFADASPMRKGENVVKYVERLIKEAKESRDNGKH